MKRVSYHLGVLADHRVVIPVGERGAMSCSFIAYLSRDPEMVEVLDATQPCDRERLGLADDLSGASAEPDR